MHLNDILKTTYLKNDVVRNRKIKISFLKMDRQKL